MVSSSFPGNETIWTPTGRPLCSPKGTAVEGNSMAFLGVGMVEQRPRDRKRLLIYGWKWLGRVFIHVHGVVSIQNLQILNSVPVDVALLCY